ncbi:hypothetical protein SLS58_007139 [Diplodia intermedia]|uniref:Lysine-specific metallo-endopeptidase domain-containing protein n=1 Tax=Diplodia intermedia TaxID=856260 RepID=A0ABR3TKV4_9PEZI
MGFTKALTISILALSQFAGALPYGNSPDPTLEARKLYSVDSSLSKRTLYNVDGIQDDTHKEILRQALKDAVEIADVVVDKMDKDRHKSKINDWFGPSDNDEYYDQVRSVLKNFVGENHDHEGADVLGQLTVYPDDYWFMKNFQQNFCDVNINGKTGTAYYKLRDNQHHGMHYCDKFFTRLSLKDYADQYLKDDCANMPDHIDTDHIGRKLQSANVLHEVMHFPLVGAAAVGKQIGDGVYGAYNCLKLQSNDQVLQNTKNPVDRTIENADSYVYYAMHIYLEEKCDREFKLPQDASDN